MSQNICLVGFMGSGKSLTSKRLATALNREVVSTDDLIVEREGRPITVIFNDSGEPYFRQVEKEVVREVSARTGVIVDCGGGVVIDPENVESLKKNGTVFFLDAPPARIFNNVKGQKQRPLLNVEDPQAKIAELLEVRRPYYERADIVIDADKPIEAIAQDILEVIGNE